MANNPKDPTGGPEFPAAINPDAEFKEHSAASADPFQDAQLAQPEDARKPSSIQEAHLDVVLDVPVTVSLEIGRTRLSIRDVLGLNPGSVVKLDRTAGDPMDIMVNGCLIAKGEVVVVGEKFGIRIIDVVSPEERVRTLK